MPGPAQRLRVVADDAEQRMARAVTSVFRDYLAAGRTAILVPTRAAPLASAPLDIPPDPDARPPAGLWVNLVRLRLLPVAQLVFGRAWRSQLTAAKTRVLDSSLHVIRFLADTTTRLTGATWPDDVHQAVRAQIARAHREHLALPELRELVRTALSLPAWSARAETIARTEGLAAVNAGAHASGLERIDVLGEPLRKRWLSTRDTRTRPAHDEVGGTTVDADAPFTVGGEQLLYPHDPHGSAANVVNCRCLVLWLDPVEEARYRVLDQHREESMTDPEPVGASVATGSPVTAAATATTSSTTTAGTGPTGIPAALAGPAAPAPPEGNPLTAAKSGMPDDLHDYWTHGEGAAKIRWGTTGSFDRCRSQLGDHVSGERLDGLCANLHHDATGKWPSEGKGQAAALAAAPAVAPTAGGLTAAEIAALTAATADPAITDTSPLVTAALAAKPARSGRPADSEDGDGPRINRTKEIDQAARADRAAEDAEDAVEDEEEEDDRDDDQVITDTEIQHQPEVQVKRGVKPEPRNRRHRVTAATTGPAADPEPVPLAAAPRGITPTRPGARTVTTPITTPATTAAAPAMTSADTPPVEAGDEESWAVRIARDVPLEPDPEAFRQEPGPRGTKMHVVNDQGWVAGYIADWDARHRVFNVPPPHDPYGGGYPKFHRHSVRTADGGRVLTGPIATNGHGDTEQTDVWAVMQHYDDPRHVAANVVVRETEHGIWAAGALRAGITPFQVALIDTYSQSGHWMPGPSGYAEELVASCCVTVEAFELLGGDPRGVQMTTMAAAAGLSTPRLDDLRQQALVDDDGRCLVLVAAGVLVPETPPATSPVDGVAVFRQFKTAQRADDQITAARRRILAPVVLAAAARIGKDV